MNVFIFSLAFMEVKTSDERVLYAVKLNFSK